MQTQFKDEISPTERLKRGIEQWKFGNLKGEEVAVLKESIL